MKRSIQIVASYAVLAALSSLSPRSASGGSLESAWARALTLQAGRFLPRLVHGTPAQPGAYPQVVALRVAGSGCTGTVVGPRAVITAAHCGSTGDPVRFSAGSDSYEAVLEGHPGYGSGGADVALAVTTEDIRGAAPATIGGTPALEAGVTVLGYGMTEPHNDSPPADGRLRVGTSRIAELNELEFRIQSEGGAIGHWGDSGGPAFLSSGGRPVLVGVLSWGPFTYATTYFARTDSASAREFLRGVAQRRGIAVCGVTGGC